MAQSFAMPVAAFEQLNQFPNLLHKRVVGDMVHATEVFSAPSNRAVHEAMDARQGEIEQLGGRVFHRTRIGRNAPCPCGSGLKFKKCCIHKAG